MAKSKRVVPVCGGLTLEGADLVFGGRRSPILEIARAAFDRAVPGSDAERELGHALGLHVVKGRWVNNVTLTVPGGLGPAGWAAVLECDPALACDLRALHPEDGRTAGHVIADALLRAAESCPDPLAVVFAVAEASRLESLTGRQTPHHARQLTVPCAVEIACWRPAPTYDPKSPPTPADPLLNTWPIAGFPDADPVAFAARLAALETVREREFRRTVYCVHPIIPTNEVLPAVRLTGGAAGRVTLRPASDSTLAWATAAWRVSRAVFISFRPAAKPRAGKSQGADELPVVVLVDGVVLAHGDLPPEAAAAIASEAEAGTSTTLAAIGGVAHACADADAFIADRTRRRDEAERLPGEERYLREIVDGWRILHDAARVPAVRQFAAELLAGDPGAPRFVAVREVVRAVKMPRRASVSQHVEAWAVALADFVAREEAEEADAREGAVLDALERDAPGALGTLLRCGEIADPWGALVALTAADGEAAVVRESLTRPAMVKRLLTLQERATRSLGSAARPHLRHEVETLVAVLRDERADCEAFLVPTFAEARRALLTCCGTAVAVRHGHRPESWRVLSGSLLALVRAGMGELQEREGVVTAEWCPPGPSTGDLTDALVEWAVQEWRAAGCEGAPPSMRDALVHNESANARSVDARKTKRR